MRHGIVATRDGVRAMFSHEAGELMHPGVGPLVEASQLYVVQSRLAERLQARTRELTLFDVGLGAGSNALMARNESERAPAAAAVLQLISFERDLDALELAITDGVSFGFSPESSDAAHALLRDAAHDSTRTRWRLRRGDVLAALRQERSRADIVFWDPFSPRANPLLWTVEAFATLRGAVSDECTVFTYSASTATRVALLLAGFAVGIGDSIGKKTQTTAAAIRVDDLARPLGRDWLQRLDRPDAKWPIDAPRDALERCRQRPQFA